MVGVYVHMYTHVTCVCVKTKTKRRLGIVLDTLVDLLKDINYPVIYINDSYNSFGHWFIYLYHA